MKTLHAKVDPENRFLAQAQAILNEERTHSQMLADEEKALEQDLKALLTQGQRAWIKSEPKPPKLGRPPKSPIEKLQVWTWYYKVKSICPPDWSDERRDQEFAGSSRTDRGKIFARVRSDGWYPERSVEYKVDSSTWTSIYLIEAVDRTRNLDWTQPFKGTKALIESPFWTIFGKEAPNLKMVRQELNALLDHHGLVRLEKDLSKIVDPYVHRIAADSQGTITELSFAGVYTQWLNFSLSRVPDRLDRLTIAGLLLRESLLLSYIDMAIILDRIVWDQVVQFASQSWMEPLKEKFVTVASEYIRRGHVDPLDESGLYGSASFRAVSGYVIARDSSFLSGSVNPTERDQWAEGLNTTCEEMSHVATNLHGPWDTTPQP
jgi:hypothetical protein